VADVEDLQSQLLTAIDAASGLEALEACRVQALGKQGEVTRLLKTLGAMSPEQRLVEGPPIQALREAVTAAIATRKAVLEAAALEAKLAAERLDMTLPADPGPVGTVHPVSQVMDELAEIFADLGFAVATGPEIEDDWHNFTALNIRRRTRRGRCTTRSTARRRARPATTRSAWCCGRTHRPCRSGPW
jgi:phenylalanyl-tRNA synthetase alpha chain